MVAISRLSVYAARRIHLHRSGSGGSFLTDVDDGILITNSFAVGTGGNILETKLLVAVGERLDSYVYS